MKAKLVPIYFRSASDPDFSSQLQRLHEHLADDAEILAPALLGSQLPDTDAVIFPEMLGQAYREVEKITNLPQPLMVVTSEFGTVSMWDWEINSYLTAKGIGVIGPTSLEKTKQVCRAFAERQLKKSNCWCSGQRRAAGNQDDLQTFLLVGAGMCRCHRAEVRRPRYQEELQEAG
jgi:hypothetical protein